MYHCDLMFAESESRGGHFGTFRDKMHLKVYAIDDAGTGKVTCTH